MTSPFTLSALSALVLCAACGGKSVQTRYYQLGAPSGNKPPGDRDFLVVEPLTTDAGYDDERIVYRTTPFRVDYYQYHRWTSAPGVMVGNYLERALEGSGKFRAVVREATPVRRSCSPGACSPSRRSIARRPSGSGGSRSSSCSPTRAPARCCGPSSSRRPSRCASNPPRASPRRCRSRCRESWHTLFRRSPTLSERCPTTTPPPSRTNRPRAGHCVHEAHA
ncbi:MAG TPA: ABC-type transport auxiliary lipoprotein family protein [Kofleriaceae bacterium]